MKSLTKIALACLFAASASSAFAAAQSAASISSIKFQVIDLNPLDGAPTFAYAGGNTSLSVSATDSSVGESESASRTRPGAFSFTRTFDATLDHVSAQAEVGEKVLQVEGAASGPGTSYNASASTGYTGYNNAVLTLSPQSMVVITATADIMASASNPATCGSYNYYYYYSGCGASESASASATMNLSYSYSSGNGSVSVNQSDSLSVSAIARGAYDVYYDYYYSYYYGYPTVTHYDKVEESKSDSRSFTAVFMNTSNLVQTASLQFSTNVSGNATTAAPTMSALHMSTPVPEADTSLLALSGLGLLLATARRRRAA
jgi:hypothetical protein